MGAKHYEGVCGMARRGPSAPELLAENLKALREKSGLSLRELADKLGWDHAHLHKMENGKNRCSEAVIEALDTFYGTGPMLKHLWLLAGQRAFRDKYKRYMELEAEARVMQQYCPSVVLGLLQTEAYARELLRASDLAGEELEDQVAARLSRQTILTNEPLTDFRAILDEAVVRRPLTASDEWREQLAHLIKMSERPNVTIQVLPLRAGLHGLHNTDTMFLWRQNGTCAAYTETSYSGDLVESPEDVQRLRLTYDRLRDLAFSPRETVAFLVHLLEDIPCASPEPS